MKFGDKVIIRSNEPGELIIGYYIEDWEHKRSGRKMPVVQDIKTGTSYLCFGIVAEYSDELLKTLKTMNEKEQWEYLKEMQNE